MNKQQLANRIWASANKMRSKIEANEYKDYILGLIFYKFLSDTEVKFLKEKHQWTDEDLPDLKENDSDPDLKKLKEDCQQSIGFFIEYDYLFSTWLNSTDFSVATLNEALGSFERLMSNNYKSVYDGIFDTLREGLGKLGDNSAAQTKSLKALIRLIKDIPTDGSQDYDVLGYVYEFLISNFAASAGKKAGEFYTPHEVAMVMSEIVAEHHKERESLSIYDPTSGSGSLLITIGKAVSKHISNANKVKYYAQELKNNTYNLTRMNLVMRGILPSNIVTRCADSLEEDWPIHEEGIDIDKPLAVDAVVSNPPYSQHWDVTDKELDARFKEYGVAPKTKADYAFLLHELHHLKSEGIMTIVLPHGVLFRGKTPKLVDKDGNFLPLELQEEGQAEGKIRANLIEKNNIDAIIGLPANIFFGTGIPTLIMVLKKNRREEGVLIIDASKGFVKDGKQNRLRACDIRKIADTYRERLTIPGYSREVSRDEIRQNDYNLNIPRYVDSSEAPVKYDILATMEGGIPNSEIDDLADYWTAFPSLRNELFATEQLRPYSGLITSDVSSAIAQNNDVKAFAAKFNNAFSDFGEALKIRLIDQVERVKDLESLDAITADIFRRTENLPLTDRYQIYQLFAERWPGIVSDIEVIQTEGLKACKVVEPNYKMVKKDGVDEEVEDGVKGRIMPFEMIQQVYFNNELQAIEALRQRLGAIDGEVDAIRDEFTEEEAEIYNDSEKEGALDKNRIKADAKPLSDIEDDTRAKLQQMMALWDEKSKKNKKLKADIAALNEKTIREINNLDVKEIQNLLRLKWIQPIEDAIFAIPDAIQQNLADAVQSLSDKYATTYNDIEQQLSESLASLAELVSQLTGDEYAIKGLTQLIRG